MGSRNLDRIPMSAWRAKVETVGEMWREGWRHVRARCETCRAQFSVDLERVLRERGPKTSLWNREQRCPKDGCAGPVRFLVRIPGLLGRCSGASAFGHDVNGEFRPIADVAPTIPRPWIGRSKQAEPSGLRRGSPPSAGGTGTPP